MGKLNTDETSSRGFVRRLMSPCMRWGYRLAGPNVRNRLGRVPGLLALYKRTLKPLLFPAALGDGLATISFPAFVMYVDPKDTMGDMATGEAWEVATTHVFKQVIRPGDIIVDVGAHWGYFTLLAATLCTETGRVYAFEPHPKNFAMLTRNIAANHLSNVMTVQSAVSNCDGSTQMFEARGSMGHSVNPLPQEWRVLDGATPRAIPVSTVKLDNFFVNNLIQPRLIKIDIEGAEPLAIEGMQGLIKRSPEAVLITEVNPLYIHSDLAKSFFGMLTGMGFETAIVDDDRRQLEFAPAEEIIKRVLDPGTRREVNLLCTRGPEVPERLLGVRHVKVGQSRIVKVTDL